jgi:threonine synthase
MNYHSTRDTTLSVTAARAIASGLAPDGGLFVPETIPRLPEGWTERLRGLSYPERAAYVMSLYLDGFTGLEVIAAEAYKDFAAPLRRASDGAYYLELFHGPTCAFKDMALQALPRLLPQALRLSGETRETVILVSTSGDTGKAALEGFKDIPGVRVLVFYPHGGVSRTQELQMTTQEGGNVGVVAVRGNFDDAQTAMKRVFADPALRAELDRRRLAFGSANSINWGRLAPQIPYYVSAYLDMLDSGAVQPGQPMDVCVPTGNFGNILAAWYAKRMGTPIGRLLCASNRNHILTDFLRTGVYDTRRDFFTTLSPSMDILVSSNLERCLYHLSGGDAEAIRAWMAALRETGRFEASGPVKAALGDTFAADFCDDRETLNVLRETFERSGVLLDPHTAVARAVADRRRGENPVVMVSTASPFKFAQAVCDALGLAERTPEALSAHTGLPVPAPLTGLEARQARFDKVIDTGDMTSAVLAFLDAN